MIVLPLLLPALISHLQPDDWSKAKAEVDQQLEKGHGIGMIVSFDRLEGNRLQYQWMQRGGDSSPWLIQFMPIDPGSGRPVEGTEFKFEGGGTPFLTKPIPGGDFSIPAGAKSLLIVFRTAHFKGMGKYIAIPEPSSSTKPIILYLPEP